MFEISARHHIENLLHRYANAIDNGDFETVATLFQDCSVVSGDGKELAPGYTKTLEFYTKIISIYPDTNTPKTQYVISNLILDVNAQNKTAQATASYTVIQMKDNGKIEVIICGHYSSDFNYVNEQWKFTKHQMHPHLIGDMSQHLKINLNDIHQKKF